MGILLRWPQRQKNGPRSNVARAKVGRKRVRRMTCALYDAIDIQKQWGYVEKMMKDAILTIRIPRPDLDSLRERAKAEEENLSCFCRRVLGFVPSAKDKKHEFVQ